MAASGTLAAIFAHTKIIPNSRRRSVRIREPQRAGDTVKQTTVRYIGVAMDDNELVLAEVSRIKLEAERRATLPLSAPEDLAVKGRATRRASKKRLYRLERCV